MAPGRRRVGLEGREGRLLAQQIVVLGKIIDKGYPLVERHWLSCPNCCSSSDIDVILKRWAYTLARWYAEILSARLRQTEHMEKPR